MSSGETKSSFPLASPGAWGDYVPVTAVWLLSLIAAQASRGRVVAGTLALVGVFQFFVLGTMPLGSWAPIGLMVALSAVGVLLMLGLFGTILALPPRVLGEATELGELLESWDRDALRPAA